jgi:hypothetical protein
MFRSRVARVAREVLFCLSLTAGVISAIGQGPARVNYANGVRIDWLPTSSQTFSNVLVYSHDPNHVFFRHAGGLGSAKVSELEPAALRRLGLAVDTTLHSSGPSIWTTLNPAIRFGQAGRLSPLGYTSLIVLAILAIGFYLYCSFLFWMICVKVGAEPGISVWLPVVQVLPLLRAAGMSALWPIFLLLLVVTSILLRANFGQYAWTMGIVGGSAAFICFLTWSFKICLARKKSPLLATLLVVPGLNFFVLLYLAGSK